MRILTVVILFCVALVANADDCSTHNGVYGCNPASLIYDKSHIEIAEKYAIYGLISNNAYSDINTRPHFELPEEWQIVRTVDDEVGLNFQLYEKKNGGNLLEVVIAFRGTQGIKDWKHGNLSNKEYEQARIRIQEVIDTYKGTPIVATGHSLGGGLAMFASYQFPNITAIGFNSSPRYHSKNHKEQNTRISIYESGDAARIFGNIAFPWRWGELNKKMGIYFVKYKFTKGSPIKNHFSYPLARGLLMLGSLNNDELADILKMNRNVPN